MTFAGALPVLENPQEQWEAGNPPRVPSTHFPAGFSGFLVRGRVLCAGGSLPLHSALGALLLSALAPLPLCPPPTVLLLLKSPSGHSSPLGLIPFSRLYSFLSHFCALLNLTLAR